jgi:gliding motility-associated-like protein
MKVIFLFLILLSFPLSLLSQNLVPNGDFEEYFQLPNQQGQLTNCKHWINPASGTPDYFHSDALPSSNFQLPNTGFATVEPYSGSAIAGLYLVVGDYREYITVQLIKPLKKGKSYTLSFAHTNGSGDYFASCGSDRFGAYFSKSIPYQNSLFPIPVVPQIEVPNFCWDTTWKNESFTFVADDDYTTLTFGNFYTSDQTTTITMVEALTVGYAYFFIDKVELIALEAEVLIEMPNVFTPNGDGVNDAYHPVSVQGVNEYQLVIFNQWGEMVFETTDSNQGWDGQFNNKDCSSGTYFWRVEYSDLDDIEDLESGFLTLVR